MSGVEVLVVGSSCTYVGDPLSASYPPPLGVPCCPHCGHELDRVSRPAWEWQIAVRWSDDVEARRIIRWAERAATCYPTVFELAAGYEAELAVALAVDAAFLPSHGPDGATFSGSFSGGPLPGERDVGPPIEPVHLPTTSGEGPAICRACGQPWPCASARGWGRP